MGARRWRVRGLPKNLPVGVLKVNLVVATEKSFHVYSFDLYAARAREHFLARATAERHVPENTLKGDGWGQAPLN